MNGDISVVEAAQRCLTDHYPHQINRFMHFNHFLAEAHSKSRDFHKALNIFYDLYKSDLIGQNPKKVTDRFSFFVRDVVSEQAMEMYAEILTLIENRVKVKGDIFPASVAWKWFFVSPDDCANDVAQYLIQEYPQIKNGVNRRLNQLSLNYKNDPVMSRRIKVLDQQLRNPNLRLPKVGLQDIRSRAVYGNRLQILLDDVGLDAAMQEYTNQANNHNFPPVSMLAQLASLTAKIGDMNSVTLLQEGLHRHYQVDCDRYLNFMHFVSEAYWVREEYAPAVSLLKDLYQEHGHEARTVLNKLLCKFVARAVSGDVYEAEGELLDISKTCADKMNYYIPLLHVWRWLFTSQDQHKHKVASIILSSYPRLVPFFGVVVPGMCEAAYEDDDKKLLERLYTLVHHQQLHNLYPIALGALLSYNCEIGDVRAAKKTFDVIKRENVMIDVNASLKYKELLSRY